MPFSWTLYYDRSNGQEDPEYCAIGYHSLESTEIYLFDDLSTPCKPMDGKVPEVTILDNENSCPNTP